MQKYKQHSISIDTEEKRQVFAEYIKERLYGSITLLAVEITLLPHVHQFWTDHALFMIISTTLGLWLASIFSSIIAYKMIHQDNTVHGEIKKSIISHRGILVAAIPSVCIIALSYFPFIPLESTLIASIGFWGIGFLASILAVFLDKEKNFIANFIIISLQIIIVIGILGIKILSH